MHIFKLKTKQYKLIINKKSCLIQIDKSRENGTVNSLFNLDSNLRYVEQKQNKIKPVEKEKHSFKNFNLFKKQKKAILRKSGRFFFFNKLNKKSKKNKFTFLRNSFFYFFFFNNRNQRMTGNTSIKFINFFLNKKLKSNFKTYKVKNREVNFFFKNIEQSDLPETNKKNKINQKTYNKYNKYNRYNRYNKDRGALDNLYFRNFRFKYQFSKFFKIKKKYKNKFKYSKLDKVSVNQKYQNFGLFLEKNSNTPNSSFFYFKKNSYHFLHSVNYRKIFLYKKFYFYFFLDSPILFFLEKNKDKNIDLSFIKHSAFSILKKNLNNSFFFNFFFQKNSFFLPNSSNFIQNFNKLKIDEGCELDQELTDSREDNASFFNLISFPNYHKIITSFDKFKKFDDFFFFYYKHSITFFQSDDFFVNFNKTFDNQNIIINYRPLFLKPTSFCLFRLKNHKTFLKFFSFFTKKKNNILNKKKNIFYYKTLNKKKNIILNKKNFFFQNFSFINITDSSNVSLNNWISGFKKFHTINFIDLVFFFNNPLFFKSYSFSKNQFFCTTDYLSIYSTLLKKNFSNTWTNLFADPSIFSVEMTRQVSFASEYRKIKSVYSYLPYETLIKFIEYCSGRRTVIKIDPFLLKSIQVEDNARCYMWSHRIKFFRKNLGPRLFLVESLQIITLCLRLRDPYVLSNWMLSMFYKISFWKYKGLLRYLQYILRYFFWPYFPDYRVKGLRFQLKGKVSVAGNARTRTVLTQIGSLSHSTYRYKVLTNLNLLRTFTGVIGFKTWMVF